MVDLGTSSLLLTLLGDGLGGSLFPSASKPGETCAIGANRPPYLSFPSPSNPGLNFPTPAPF